MFEDFGFLCGAVLTQTESRLGGGEADETVGFWYFLLSSFMAF